MTFWTDDSCGKILMMGGVVFVEVACVKGFNVPTIKLVGLLDAPR